MTSDMEIVGSYDFAAKTPLARAKSKEGEDI